MEINYVLMYGTPYLQYREFETFKTMSKFIVNNNIVYYSIFKKLEDKDEVEMIYRDNDIRYLEKENKQLKENWNKLREFINLNYYDGYMYSSTIINKMQELENGDSNE